ncbi:hypothetical protein WA026_015102 [Henosepilachna vigintioctopunctata]|uniref:Uncharacterized protein n=1 Tax=Henosepilachna vigintioctopunctata TaxID=420089 RepID=A0AAW1TKR1_9CUCU
MVNEQENSVKCCNSENTNVSVVDMKDLPEESLRIEITYLKMLLIEKNARINELIKINQLLEENNALVSGENEKFKNSKFTKVDNNNVAQMVAEKKQPPVSDNSYKNIVVQKHDLPVRLTRAKNAEALMNKQLNLMNEIINVNHDQTDVNADKPPTTNNIQDGFTEVEHKRQNNAKNVADFFKNSDTENKNTSRTQSSNTEWKTVSRRKTIVNRAKFITSSGPKTSTRTAKFSGALKKRWLYVGRIAGKDVPVESIREYLTEINGYEEIEIKKLESKGRNSSFSIGVLSNEIFERLNSEDFWLNGVIVREFSFRNFFLKTSPS